MAVLKGVIYSPVCRIPQLIRKAQKWDALLQGVMSGELLLVRENKLLNFINYLFWY